MEYAGVAAAEPASHIVKQGLDSLNGRIMLPALRQPHRCLVPAQCEVDALGGEPCQRRGAELGAEAPVQCGGAEVSVTGEIRDGQRRAEPGAGPVKGL